MLEILYKTFPFIQFETCVETGITDCLIINSIITDISYNWTYNRWTIIPHYYNITTTLVIDRLIFFLIEYKIY